MPPVDDPALVAEGVERHTLDVRTVVGVPAMFNTDHDVGSESGRLRFQFDRLVALSYLTFSEAGLKGFKRLAPEIVSVVGSRLE